MTIPITKPVFGPEEMRAIQLPLETGWVVQGPHVQRFEQLFSAFIGSRFSAAATSCTTALHLAIAALGVRPGDEVIVPAFTWVATANVVEYVGARPVFCDVQLDTFNLDVAHAETLITPRTVGIMPVHLFGLCADMDGVMALAQKHRLWVIEDAACGFGARFGDRHAGTFGDAGCFSFHPRKSITTGEGGMLTTQREELDQLVRCLRDHGASRTDLARHQASQAFLLADYDHLGFNYRMTDLQGALGCAQMGRAADVLQQRAQRARRYDRLLSDLDWLATPRVPAAFVHGYQAYVCLFQPEKATLANVERLHTERNTLMGRLEQHGVATRQGTHAPVLLGYYRDKYHLRPGDFPRAYIADRLSLALPLFPQMTDVEQDLVVQCLREAVHEERVA